MIIGSGESAVTVAGLKSVGANNVRRVICSGEVDGVQREAVLIVDNDGDGTLKGGWLILGNEQNVLICATNYGTWAEELQAQCDACKKAGFEVTLATPQGKKPLPFSISIYPDFFDPIQKVHVNPKEVCDRCKELVDGDEWAHPIKFADINIDDYDAIAMAGGPGVTLDFCNSWELHQAILKAVKSDKIVAALCYSVGALVFCRDPENDYKSVIYGKRITAHPRT